jgi:hypothetical protein
VSVIGLVEIWPITGKQGRRRMAPVQNVSGILKTALFMVQTPGRCENNVTSGRWTTHVFDIHGSVHHNKILIKMTNKMHLCRIIYYSIVPWLLYMLRVISSLIISSILTVITASGFIHMYCCRLMSWLNHDSSQQQYM